REYQADPLGALARHFGWQFLSYCYGTVTAFGGGFVNEISFGLMDFSYDDKHKLAHYAGLIAANVLGGIPKAGLSATVRGGKAMAKVALPRVIKESGTVARKVSSGAENVNAQSALRAKLSGLEKAQQNAATTRQLPDGRVRYYTQEVPARTEGPTRGASFVTEHNPQNGNVRQWMESYDHAGSVNRVHPKSINGQTVNSQHYPPVTRELGL
uniref:hypothetical protein n=1 Tax=Fastidiosibacter lacustris TaxID=2056695 RepID=UPI0019567A64